MQYSCARGTELIKKKKSLPVLKHPLLFRMKAG